MTMFNKDGFTFFEGFFKQPVFNFDNNEIKAKIDYLKDNHIKSVSFDNSIEDFSFLQEIDFLEEVYLSKNINPDCLYTLKNIKRFVINIEKGKPDIDYSKFKKLEYLSMDWYSSFPDLSNNAALKELVIWKFRPKSKSFTDLRLPLNLENFQITESNIVSFEGLSIPNLKKFEGHYCNSLESLKGIDGISDSLHTLILDYCRKLTKYDEIVSCAELSKIVLGDCGDIPNLKWLNKMKKVKHFSFWGTKVIDGDTSPCFGIDYVNFKNQKNYSHKVEEFN